jgi:hypothetical protein
VGRAARGDEELRAVGVGAGVGHREQHRRRVIDHAELPLIRKGLAVYRLAARAVRLRQVAAVQHEARDHPVEAAPLEVQRLACPTFALLARAEEPEVLYCPWAYLGEERHCDG